MDDHILDMRAIGKEFPGVKALDHVDLRVRRGEIHALIGENGAGKSTLMKVLSGVYPHGSYTGEIVVDGRPAAFKDIRQSEAAGIVIIHQELALVPQLSIAENIFLGNERGGRGLVDWRETNRQAMRLMAAVGLVEDPEAPVSGIGVGKQQLVEIAKALSKEVRLLILDEPTAALNEADSAGLLALLRALRDQGITSILISHKLNEVTAVADRITILRDGRTIETLDAGSGAVDEDRIIKGMVGRDLDHRFPPREPEIGELLFEVEGWTVDHPTVAGRRVVKDASVTVRRGEIVGIAGLMGAGRTELAMSVFGRSYGSYVGGEVRMNGRALRLRTVSEAIDAGIAYVTEDRKQFGLLLDEDIRRNTTLAALRRVSKRGVIDLDREVVESERLRERLRVKTPTVFQKTGNLSGGNQQKVVLGKWIFTEPELLILDEPTRGIDVGAKYEIYGIVHQLAAEGRGVLVISSELPELLGLCDRVYAMNQGRVTGELPRREATQEAVMRLMTDSATPAGTVAP
ncbi:multiple monosaccharide ABC transporter ATP-binding protein [Phytomonospora endophytica]|uniref:Putative multiple sugar transport system ATP-binding protein n=1 Tax=Phytomonospora endophytica TaxID=714109 RepID=A0A841FPL2_9ACTN|nr:multiple monosaccharide ABC transporter ATP-binding protein [Phytomonospora endophytica]MBB6036783.1 putative multiple sugar transport system ATP-binding protein [Phytomonospora endophytica]GIG68183.1 xylose ABC transporter ATP-binding protein [Phytomonospora endophytica]